MDRFFDEAARILAGPMPRRRAVALLGGALFAAILGTNASAQLTCNPGCLDGQKCCPGSGGANNFCCLNEFLCEDFILCDGGNGNHCNQKTELCCGAKCCNQSNTICCGNLNCCGPHACGTDGRCQISNPPETSQP